MTFASRIDASSVPATACASMSHWASVQPTAIAATFLVDGEAQEQHLTYGELDSAARAIAAELQERLGAGGSPTTALLLYPPGLEFIPAFLGCLYAGVVAVPVYPPRSGKHLERMEAVVRDCRARIALTSKNAHERVSGFFLGSSELRKVPLVATDGIDAARASQAQERELAPDALAFLQYTSGSTGTPKGVMITHANLSANLRAIGSAYGSEYGEHRVVSWLPIFHDMGLIGSTLFPLSRGGRVVCMSPLAFLEKPVRWLRALTHYRGTESAAPNFGYELCIKQIREEEKAGLDLTSWRVAWCGAETVRSETLRRFERAFAGCGYRPATLFPCYGMAENTLLASCGRAGEPARVLPVDPDGLARGLVGSPRDPERRLEVVSCGRPTTDSRLVVVDPETCRELPADRVGEIWIGGPSVARGYWNRPEETERTFQARLADRGDGPFLRTGDLGFLHEGELHVTGRLKDLVIVRGRNLYPQDIEAAAERDVSFSRANGVAAFAIEGPDTERLVVVVELPDAVLTTLGDPGKRAKAEGLIAKVRGSIASEFEAPVHEIVCVRQGTFPRTTSGKVQRSRCRQMYLAGELDVVFPVERASVPAPVRAPRTPPTLTLAKAEIPEPGSSRERAEDVLRWLRDYGARRLNSRLIDERRTIPPYVVLDFGNHGLLGLEVPREQGGLGLSTEDALRVMEQVAAIDLTLSLFLGIHNGLGVRPIQRFGSAALQRDLLPTLAGGRELAGFALTEPGAGSNPQAMQAMARRVPGGWRLTAEKRWIGNASWAGALTVFARAQEEDGAPLGTIALVVRADNPGLRQGPEALTMGVRGVVQNTVFLENAFVPDADVLGRPGDGMQIAQDAMMHCRMGIAAAALGAMQRCSQLMVRYAERRQVGTGPLLANPVTLARLSELEASIVALRQLVQAFAQVLGRGETLPDEAYIVCKTAGPELAWSAADQLVQLLGGRGYVEPNEAPQILRDVRILRIFEGPTETLCMHLGACIQRDRAGIDAVLGRLLEAPDLAERLAQECAGLAALAHGGGALAVDPVVARQWAQHEIGRLATAVALEAAARLAERASARREAEERCRRRREALAAEIRSVWQLGLPSPGELRQRVHAHAERIGDVTQTLAGEDRERDVLLAAEMAPGPQAPAREERAAWLAESVPVAAPRLARPPRPSPTSTSPSQVEEPSIAVERHEVPAQPLRPNEAVVVEALRAWVREEQQRELGEIDLDAAITDLGVDSLGVVAIVSDVEQRVGRKVHPESLYQFPTVRRFGEYLDQIGCDPTAPLDGPAASAAPATPPAMTRKAASAPDPWQRYRELNRRFDDWKARDEYFFAPEIEAQTDAWIVTGGKRMLLLGSYSYLGLLKHARLNEVGKQAIDEYGVGHHGARLLAGTSSLHRRLERRLASALQAADALVYSSGFVTNLATIAALVGPGDVVIGDEYNHASIVDGCRFSGAEFLMYRHQDTADLARCLARARGRHTLVVVDGVFSMDGDVVDLPAVSALCREHGALLMVDEAHSFGVLGPRGLGVLEHFDLPGDAIDVKMGTLSKALSSSGGFVAGSQTLVDYLRHHARGYMFSGALPNAEVAAAEAALDVLRDEPARLARLWRNRQRYFEGVQRLGFDTFTSTTPIVPLATHTEEKTLALTRTCRDQGLFVVPVFYPAVPKNAPRLRTCVMASHTDEDIDFALDVLGRGKRAVFGG